MSGAPRAAPNGAKGHGYLCERPGLPPRGVSAPDPASAAERYRQFHGCYPATVDGMALVGRCPECNRARFAGEPAEEAGGRTLCAGCAERLRHRPTREGGRPDAR